MLIVLWCEGERGRPRRQDHKSGSVAEHLETLAHQHTQEEKDNQHQVAQVDPQQYGFLSLHVE